MVRGLPRRGPCHLAHAGTAPGPLRRMETRRREGMEDLRHCEDSRRKIAALPEHPEDLVLDCLEALAIPVKYRQDYLSLQLAALPGWAGFIKWRAEETDYAWQQAYPVGLVKFLAVRLWYVRELVQKVCQRRLRHRRDLSRRLGASWTQQPHAYYMRKEWVCRSPSRLLMADRVARLHAQARATVSRAHRLCRHGNGSN
jgi:uncharacterized protein YbcC (UPF0753/DUF2309 family)